MRVVQVNRHFSLPGRIDHLFSVGVHSLGFGFGLLGALACGTGPYTSWLCAYSRSCRRCSRRPGGPRLRGGGWLGLRNHPGHHGGSCRRLCHISNTQSGLGKGCQNLKNIMRCSDRATICSMVAPCGVRRPGCALDPAYAMLSSKGCCIRIALTEEDCVLALALGRNVEIKAQVHDMAGLRSRAAQLSGTAGSRLEQEDVFFVCSTGKCILLSNLLAALRRSRMLLAKT